MFAQRLLFRHSQYGDLNPLFSGYFDTRVGAKVEADAYRHIPSLYPFSSVARRERCCFLSGIEAELDAAPTAGLQTVWLVSEGELATNAGHRQVRDFTTISV